MLGNALNCMSVVTVIAWYTQVPVTLTINWDCAHDIIMVVAYGKTFHHKFESLHRSEWGRPAFLEAIIILDTVHPIYFKSEM